jgi:hypothetical protein
VIKMNSEAFIIFCIVGGICGLYYVINYK